MAIKHEFLRYLTRLVGLLENVLGIPDDHLAIGVGSSKDIPFDNWELDLSDSTLVIVSFEVRESDFVQTRRVFIHLSNGYLSIFISSRN